MKCPNCLYESEQDFTFCPKCGVQVQSEQVHTQAQPILMPNINPAASRLLPLLKDNMFLAICVLVSVWTLLSFDVISILLTIFLWLTFAKSRKNIVDTKHLRQISGTIYASYVIINVASIMYIVLGVLYTGLIVYAMNLVPNFEYELSKAFANKLTELQIDRILNTEFLAIIIFAVGIIMLVIGLVALLINLLGFRKIHRFVKSVHTGITSNNYELAYRNSVKGWLIFFAVLRCMGTVLAMGSGISVALATGSQAAAIIITVVLINKYLIPQKLVNMNIL